MNRFHFVIEQQADSRDGTWCWVSAEGINWSGTRPAARYETRAEADDVASSLTIAPGYERQGKPPMYRVVMRSNRRAD